MNDAATADADTRAPLALGLPWQPGFAALGPAYFTELRPTPLPSPTLVGFNPALAAELGLDAGLLSSPAGVDALTGNHLPEGATPLATVYSGHQFGVWAGQLGDGRAILLGELATAAGPQEVQLKGSGRTPYSRMGDGRAVLRSSIREFLGSEAMHGLGIPTTRALMVTGSPAPVRREEVETAAVVTRTAPSFIRFGHFEHFAARGQEGELRKLADYVIDRFYPQCRGAGRFGGNPYAAFLEQVSERTATLLSHWQAVGFCHGVMNTDNMSILGLTIDYGPFQFMDAFDPRHICNHSDEQGRYAFGRQPNVAYWNLFCLAQALMPLIGEEEVALAALESYKTAFPRELQARLRDKLGLEGEAEGDLPMFEALFQLLAQDRVDHTLFWRALSQHVAGGPLAGVRDLFIDIQGFDAWRRDYEARLPVDRAAAGLRMLRGNPKYVLRNHLAELAIRDAKLGDYSRVQALLGILHAPYDEHPDSEDMAGVPPEWAREIEISCSS